MLFWEIIRACCKDHMKHINTLYGQSEFLGAFQKLRKATIRFAMTVRPSVYMKQLSSHWTNFYEI
jgi:hypothetical protein